MRAIGLLLLVACSDREANPAVVAVVTPTPDAPAPAPPADRGPLSAEAPVWPEATGPAGPITFKRDFKKPGSWLYDYRQNVTLTADIMGDIRVNAIQAKGTLAVESKRDGTAIARLSANLIAQEAGDKSRQQSGPMSMELPLDETGVAHTKDDQAALVALLLPFPSKPMKVGDTESVRFKLPVSGVPGMAEVEGPLTFKLVGFSKLGTRTCARFDTKLALDKTHATAHVKMSLTGKVCVDPADGAVVGSFLAIDMRASDRGKDPVDMSFAGVLGLDRI